MRSSLLAAATIVALALPLTPAAGADPGGRPPLPPAASDTARERAEAALARAEALFDATPAEARRRADLGGPDATMVLNELLRTRTHLTPKDRDRADAVLARPDDRGADPYGDGYQVREERPVCGDAVCIHYVATTEDAPPMADDDRNGVPDHVEDTLETAEGVHDTYTSSGYLGPDPDARRGGDSRVDIYLADVGADRLYGYCASDQPEKNNDTWNYWAYCVIDNDFHPDQFGTWNSPTENEQVTLAHEYFHAIQYAYDAYEDWWLMEATATWAEDELFDEVDDNHQYLPAGQLRRPWLPLDTFDGSATPYGNWIFFRYLTERWSAERGALPRLVLDVWEQASGRADDPDMYSTEAIQSALVTRGTSFKATYGRFGAANRHPARNYEEGAAYPRPWVNRRFALGRGNRKVGPRSLTLDHLTHATVRYRPGKGTRPWDWRLRIIVDTPHRRTDPVARVVVTRTDGQVVHKVIRLNRRGVGKRTVGFSSRRVKKVDLLLINASRRTKCPPKGYTYSESVDYACFGIPKDDQRRSVFRGRSFRR